MQQNELGHILEAILFVTGAPVAIGELAKALDTGEDEVTQAVAALESEYDYNRRGFCIKRFGSLIQLGTRPEYADYVEKLLQPVQKQSLSQAAMETLAIIAYRQPITKAEVEVIRGVKCDYSIQSLANKGLIQEVGRKEALGRPFLYGTTDGFLKHFGIESLDQLPALPEQAENDEPHDTLIP